MKSSNAYRRLVPCCLIMILCFTKVQAQSREEQVLLRTEQASRTLKSLYAKLRQEVQDQQIGGREKYEGELYIKRIAQGHDRGRIEYDNGQLVLFDNGRIVPQGAELMPVSTSMQQGKISIGEEMQFFTTQYTRSARTILNEYTVVLAGDKNISSSSTVLLELTPKGRSELAKIRWWIEKETWLPIKVEFDRRNGNKAAFILSDMKKNIRIEGNVFIPLPKLKPLKGE